MADIDQGQQSQQQQAQQNPPAQSSQRSNAGSASSRPSGRSKQTNPAQQLSTIEKSVTHLLVATKQLLETLTQWSRGNASESEVSDVYVRLGYEFNIACRAFAAIGVDTGDLGPVPDLLRTILEDTLSQEASQASLDRYLPRIRDIIINLLHGLKRKQSRLRMKENGGLSREGSDEAALAGGALPRQSSVSSNLSRDSSLTQQLEEFPTRTGSVRPQGSSSSSSVAAPPVDLPPRTTSFTRGTQSPRRTNNVSPQNSTRQANRDTLASESGSSVSSNALQNIPVIAPYPETDTMPSIQTEDFSVGGVGGSDEAVPAPPSKQNDALSALQRGGELERRASRRFSAYQIQKHLGTSGIAAIPPAQNSPIPNRGRDVRESLSAVRSRGNTFTRTKSRGRGAVAAAQEASPNRNNNNNNTEVRRISEADEREEKDKTNLDTVSLPPPTTSTEPVDSPNVKTPEDKLGNYPFPETPASPEKVGATVSGPLADPFPQQPQATSSTGLPRQKSATSMRSASRRADTQTPPPPQYLPESPPQPGKELTLFLQYKSKIKKFVLGDGGDLTIPRLQLAFIEKFAWNTHNNGVDLPEIYIQDPVSGVRHELEDLSDIRERSVLVLNVEALDEVKRHFDDGLGGIRRIIEGIRTSVDDQQSAIQRVSDRQQETARELAGIAAAPRAAPVAAATLSSAAVSAAAVTTKDGQRSVSSPSSAQDKASQLTEVQSLRRDLAVVRQTYTSFVSDMNASMAALRTKAASVKTAAKDSVIIPTLDNSTGRAYVDNGKKQLSDDSEKIVNRVDDLQDIVEDLRKDVVTRGVRPLPRQLETVSKDISTATADLKKLQEFLKKEKPIWTKIWEKELQVVCDDRDLLTLQEELAVDLEDDLEKAAATFALVEQATKQQNLHQPDDNSTPTINTNNNPAIAALGGGSAGSRNASNSSVGATAANLRSASGRTLPLRLFNPDTHPSASDPQKAKDSVLGEVRALQPNHESRLEAIERAERARQRELDSRKGGEFQRELGDFVGEGRLKKTGGVEEVERIRKVREDAARKEVLERQAQRMRERAEKDAAAAAAAAASTNASNAAADGQTVAPATDAAVGAAVNGNSADVDTTASGAGAVPSLPALDIPAPLGAERSRDDASPEPRFEDAKEDVASPDAGTEVKNGIEDGKAF